MAENGMIRREFLKYSSAIALWPNLPRAEASQPFSEDYLLALAREVASQPYVERPKIEQAWIDLTYDQYRAIRFKPKRSIWSGTDTTLEFDVFPPGLYFTSAVEVNIVENGMFQSLPFDISFFEMDEIVPDLPVEGHLGYAGIRLRAEIIDPGFFREYAVFQGASYFRVIARDLAYGLSARGLAVNTAEPEGEEFPYFTRFWVEKPAPGSRIHHVHALLESPSVTGLYHFALNSIEGTTDVEVRCTLWPRADLENVGIAPLTSMFFFDETNRNRFDDFRPAVHDSDGLTILNGNGEMLWRPLANPRNVEVSTFSDTNPRGFGLAQRERRFSNFEDLEAHYHQRPSVWITPGENWGDGAVTLVEIPSDKEIYDNIVAYWRPGEPLRSGSESRFTYRMEWTGDLPEKKPLARVLNTRMGKGSVINDNKAVVIDFSPHAVLPEDFGKLVLRVTCKELEIIDQIIQRNPETNGPRAIFSFNPGDVTLAEMRAELLFEEKAVSEVWLYRWIA